MRKLRNLPAVAMLVVTALLVSGCESIVFAFANRGLTPPDATVSYAPQLDLALDVYRPRGAAAGGAPTVVFLYGGAWRRGQRGQYQFVGRRLAENGVLAIIPDYRKYPDTVFPGFVEDAARAVAWAREHADEYGGDPQRLFIAGHSAGAQIAGLLGADAGYLRQQGVALDDIAGVIGLSGPYEFEVSGKLRPVFGPPSRWPQAQVIDYIDGDEPPFLLIHGADDDRVETSDSVQLAEKLRAHGVPAELLILPDAGHSAPLWGLYDPGHQPAVLPAILDFVGAARR